MESIHILQESHIGTGRIISSAKHAAAVVVARGSPSLSAIFSNGPPDMATSIGRLLVTLRLLNATLERSCRDARLGPAQSLQTVVRLAACCCCVPQPSCIQAVHECRSQVSARVEMIVRDPAPAKCCAIELELHTAAMDAIVAHTQGRTSSRMQVFCSVDSREMLHCRDFEELLCMLTVQIHH